MPLEKLIKGFKIFRSSYFGSKGRYEDLVENGQAPEALVIACSDSRNDPALLTQSEPGDIFVVRNVAAIVPPYQPDDHYHGTSAAIEFAVKSLKIANIIVLGHALCGGVQALAGERRADLKFEFLSQWITIGAKARETVDRVLEGAPRQTKLQALEQAVILTSLNNLMTFPWIRDGIEKGSITLHGWYFDMVNGVLLGYDFAAGEFREIKRKTGGFSGDPGSKKECCKHWPVEDMVRKLIPGKKKAS